MLKQIINVQRLEGIELDYYVAQTLGYKVLGKALAYYDPESGYPSIDRDQKVNKTGFLATHERYFYVASCGCDICQELYLEMKEDCPDMQPEPKVLGHDWRCLQPIVDYSTNDLYIAEIMDKGNIMIYPDNTNPDKKKWIAKNIATEVQKEEYVIEGETIAQAVMRVFVATKYGLSIYK